MAFQMLHLASMLLGAYLPNVISLYAKLSRLESDGTFRGLNFV